MDDAVLSSSHPLRALTAVIVAMMISFAVLMSSTAAAGEIWMYAAPHINNAAPGWEGVRADAGDMWRPNAPWETVAHSVKVIQFAPTNVDHSRAEDLKEALADIKRRNIAFAVGDGLLVRSERCRSKTEAYIDQSSLEHLFQKLRNNGADVKYVTMDEPFFFGHRDSSATACHESPQALAHGLAQGIAIVRKYFPNAQFGADEVVNADKSYVQELAQWTDTYKSVVGEPLAYIHADLDWSEGAVHNLVPLAAALKQRHIPLGIIYDADRFSKSDEAWAHNTVAHFTKVESELGVHPDHAVIETWVHYPTRMLPESQPGAFTNVVLQYIQRHPH
jgi:hypothetical protein